MKRGFVIDRDLLTRPDIAQSNEEDVVVENLHKGIRLARVINVVRAISTAAAIQAPAVVDCTDPECLSFCSAVCFRVSYLFARVFGNLSPASKRFRRETAFAVNSRLSDRQPGNKLSCH